jgi:hypothetical protein
LTTPQPDEQGPTAPIELPGHQPPPPPPPEPATLEIQPDNATHGANGAPPLVARAATPTQQEVLFVPLAVNVGDGFKFGCGFFLAMMIAALVGFVLLAALFVITGLFGLNLPLSR